MAQRVIIWKVPDVRNEAFGYITSYSILDNVLFIRHVFDSIRLSMEEMMSIQRFTSDVTWWRNIDILIKGLRFMTKNIDGKIDIDFLS